MDNSENKIELSLEFPGGLPSAEELLKAAELEQAAKYPSSSAMGVGPAPSAPPLPRQPGEPQPQHTVPPPVVQPALTRAQRRQKNVPQPYPAAAPGYAPVPAQVQKPVHRVGTLTMGVALIFTGLCITLGMLDPNFTMLTVLKFSPLILVLLGVEVCISSLAVKSKKLKYDGLSMFYCFLLIVASMGASLIPSLWHAYGPQREFATQRLEGELYDLAEETIAQNPDVMDFSASVWLNGYLGMEKSVDWANLSLDQIDNLGNARISVVVKPTADTEAFALSCVSVWEQLSQKLPFSLGSRKLNVDFTDGNDRYLLTLDRYSMSNPTVENFVQRTQTSNGVVYHSPTGEHTVGFEDNGNTGTEALENSGSDSNAANSADNAEVSQGQRNPRPDSVQNVPVEPAT